jgi:hypothetical protein
MWSRGQIWGAAGGRLGSPRSGGGAGEGRTSRREGAKGRTSGGEGGGVVLLFLGRPVSVNFSGFPSSLARSLLTVLIEESVVMH